MVSSDMRTVYATVARGARCVIASDFRIARARTRIARSLRRVSIRGGSHGDDDLSVAALRERIRGFLKTGPPPKISAGISQGAACVVCHRAIISGEREYDLVYSAIALRLDARCFLIWEEESRRL